MVWRRAGFRLNIATHSRSSVREQSQEDLFLPLTHSVPQTGLSMTSLICGSREVLIARNLPLFLVSLAHVFTKASNVSLPSGPFELDRCPCFRKLLFCACYNPGQGPAQPNFYFLLVEVGFSERGLCPRSLRLGQGRLARRRLSGLSYFAFPVEVGSVFPELVGLAWLVVELNQR